MVNGTGKTVITLPQYFKDYGNYYTVGSGKIFHPGTASGGNGSQCSFGDDQPYSWSEPYWDCGQGGNGHVTSTAAQNCPNPYGCVQSQSCQTCLSQWGCLYDNSSKTSVVCPADCDDDCFPDADVATQTLKYFSQVTDNGQKQPDQPFFIAAGLKRVCNTYLFSSKTFVDSW